MKDNNGNRERSLSDLVVTMLWLALLVVVQSQEASATPCQFCTRGQITTPEKPVSIPGYEFIDSCGTIDSLIPLLLEEGSPECDLVSSVSSLCGCPELQDSCSFCPDGSSVPYPDRNVTWLSEQFGGLAPTCELVEAYVSSLSASGEECAMFQLPSSFCGCPPLENHCKFCSGEPLREEFYNKELPFLRSESLGTKDIGFTPTCETFFATQYQIENRDEFLCYGSRIVSYHCGCDDGNMFYHGTADPTKHAVLVWLPRVVGILSLCSSLLVLFDILRDPKKRNTSMYHQLVGTSAVFDIITSLVWIVGPAAISTVEPVSGLEAGIYGANGNETTCKVQAYFFQLGLTSIFMNVSLTAYFMLVVAFGYRERRLRRHRLWLFGVPLLIGIGLSFAVIPYTAMAHTHCQLDSVDKVVNLVFGTVPILFASSAILTMLFVIHRKVRRQTRRSKRWEFTPKSSQNMSQTSAQYSSGGCPTQQEEKQKPKPPQKAARKLKLEKMVFRQCLAYAAAFGITWPFLAVALVVGGNLHGELPYAFWITVTATAALQGFNNALCYFRLRKKPRTVFHCGKGFRRATSRCCSRMAHNGNRLAGRYSLDRLYRSSIDPRVSAESNTTPSQSDECLDFADELANFSDDEGEEEDVVTSTTKNDNRGDVIAECALESARIAEHDGMPTRCPGEEQSLNSSQRSVESPIEKMEQQSGSDERCV